MVVGLPYEPGGVEAGPGEVAQSFCQLRQEWIRGGSGSLCGEQLPPSPIFVGSRSGKPLVELLLEESSGAA